MCSLWHNPQGAVIKTVTWPQKYYSIKHLVELGHKHIGYLDLPLQELQDDLGYAFYMGQGFERAKKDFNVWLIKQPSGRSNQDSYQSTKALLKEHKNITAIVVLLGATYLGVS